MFLFSFYLCNKHKICAKVCECMQIKITEQYVTRTNRAGVTKLYAINKQMQNFIIIYISLTKDLANTFWYVLIFWGFQCADFNVLGLLSCQLWKIPELIFHSTIKPSQKSLSLCTFSDSLTLFLTSCIASSMSCFHTVYHLPLKAPCYKHLLRWGERWSNTGLYKTILDYIRLYRTIQDYTGLYRTIQHYISLYRTIYDSLFHSENWEQTHTQTDTQMWV